MRKRFEAQYKFTKTPIELVRIPEKSRDELPPVLAALQWIFKTSEVNEQIFKLLEEKGQNNDEPERGQCSQRLA